MDVRETIDGVETGNTVAPNTPPPPFDELRKVAAFLRAQVNLYIGTDYAARSALLHAAAAIERGDHLADNPPPTPPVDELQELLAAMVHDTLTATHGQWTELLAAAINIAPVVTTLRADLAAAREALESIRDGSWYFNEAGVLGCQAVASTALTSIATHPSPR